MRPSVNHFRVPSAPSLISLPESQRSRSRLRSKYDYVRASVDSGLNMLKVNEKFPGSKANARFKKEEYFRRITPTTLVRLLDEGEVDCLLLDVRDYDAYHRCRLKDAVSFPAPLLRRSVNIFSLEILNFINKEPKKIIVIYDENGFSLLSTGNLFAEKGVNNIFVLNGGLKDMALLHPEFVEGQYPIPTPCYPGTRTPSLKSEPFSVASFSTKSQWCTASSRFTRKP